MIAMSCNNSVAFAFWSFVFLKGDASCFLKCFLKNFYCNTWHSFNSFEKLAELNSFLQDIKKSSFRCTYAPIETEFEHCVETIHKLIIEVNAIHFVKRLLYTSFWPWVLYGSDDQK